MIADLKAAKAGNFIDSLFPTDGPLRRELYQKHLEFFRAGKQERERAFMAANRIGKTLSGGGYETALHLTGKYPEWWDGRVFKHPIRAWACGDTNETVREILQPALFGPLSDLGTGLIRRDTIKRTINRRGNAESIESATIWHTSGGESTLLFKSYEQGRKAFQGTQQDLIWLDEECSMNIYAECLLRTAATDPAGSNWGCVLATFTPLLGISDVVMHFLGGTEEAPAPQPRVERMLRETAEARQVVKRDLMGDMPPDPLPPAMLETSLR